MKTNLLILVSLILASCTGRMGNQSSKEVTGTKWAVAASATPIPTPNPSPSAFDMCPAPPRTKCELFNMSCNVNIAASVADSLGQLLPASCGLESAVGAGFTIAGWDPNASAEQNLLQVETDLVCQILECIPPVDPATIAMKCGCAGFSWARTGLSCWQLKSECESELAEQPPQRQECSLTESQGKVNPCDRNNENADELDIQSACLSNVGFYMSDDGAAGKFPVCVADCVRDALDQQEAGVCEARRNRPRPTRAPAPSPEAFPQIILVR